MTDDRPIALPDGSVVHCDPEIMSGVPVFVGTRVPASSLVEYLTGGYTLDEFLDNFPTVRREQANAFLEQGANALLQKWGMPRLYQDP